MNNNTHTIGIVGKTELEDVRIYSDEKSDLDKSIVKIGMTGQLISSRNISSSEEMIMPLIILTHVELKERNILIIE